jgi:hypothetical protein
MVYVVALANLFNVWRWVAVLQQVLRLLEKLGRLRRWERQGQVPPGVISEVRNV